MGEYLKAAYSGRANTRITPFFLSNCSLNGRYMQAKTYTIVPPKPSDSPTSPWIRVQPYEGDHPVGKPVEILIGRRGIDERGVLEKNRLDDLCIREHIKELEDAAAQAA